jgi:hypothetical protein
LFKELALKEMYSWIGVIYNKDSAKGTT